MRMSAGKTRISQETVSFYRGEKCKNFRPYFLEVNDLQKENQRSLAPLTWEAEQGSFKVLPNAFAFVMLFRDQAERGCIFVGFVFYSNVFHLISDEIQASIKNIYHFSPRNCSFRSAKKYDLSPTWANMGAWWTTRFKNRLQSLRKLFKCHL